MVSVMVRYNSRRRRCSGPGAPPAMEGSFRYRSVQGFYVQKCAGILGTEVSRDMRPNRRVPQESVVAEEGTWREPLVMCYYMIFF